MKCNLKQFFVFCFLISICLGQEFARAEFQTVEFGGETWEQLKGKHFIIYYSPNSGKAEAKRVLKASESFYKEIGDTVGFTRFSDFWTWDQRAKIFIFPDQKSFVRRTGAPLWSTGYSDRDSYLFQSRVIVTYDQEQQLFNELLPHEISHLILHDFIPLQNLPVWIDEGIAQLNEKNKYYVANQIMKQLVHQKKYVPLTILNRWDIRQEKDSKKVEVFYAESLSVIRFLREEYGAERFRTFCRNLRDGKPVEEALHFAYPQDILSLKELEDRWVEFMMNQ